MLHLQLHDAIGRVLRDPEALRSCDGCHRVLSAVKGVAVVAEVVDMFDADVEVGGSYPVRRDDVLVEQTERRTVLLVEPRGHPVPLYVRKGRS